MRLASLGFDSLTNGPGLRRVIFFQGCSLACPECFNEHTWDFNGGIEATPQELYNLIDGHVIDKKVTLSGGNPLEQKDLYSLLKLFEAGDYDICVYTGFTYEYCIENYRRELELIDLLIDGPYLCNRPKLTYRGSDNQRMIKCKESVKQNKIILEDI